MPLEQLGSVLKASEFTGRKDILKDLYGDLDKGAAAIALKGAGGSGKTALLQQVVNRFARKQYAFIVQEGEIIPEILLKQIYNKAKKKNTPNAADTFSAKDKPLREKILWFVEHFLQQEKIMLIFEDFGINLDSGGKFKNERLKEFLVYLKESLEEKNSFMAFTAERDIPGFTSTLIPPLDPQEFKTFLSRCRALSRLGGKDAEQLRFDMGSNPRVLCLLDQVAFLLFKEKKFRWETLKKKVPQLEERVLYKENPDADFSPLLLELLASGLEGSAPRWLEGLSIFRRAVKAAGLEALKISVSGGERSALVRLGLLEYFSKSGFYRLHPLTARFFAGKMSDAAAREFFLRAAAYYEALSAEEGEEYIENRVSARHFYMEAGEWDTVARLSMELDQFLTGNGYPQLAFDMLEEMRGKDYRREFRLAIAERLSVFYTIFGKPDRLIEQEGELVEFYREDGNHKGMAEGYRRMAAAYESKRKFDEAITHLGDSLELWEQLKEAAESAFNLLQMGNIQRKRGKHDEAATFYERARVHAGTVDKPGLSAEVDRQMGQLKEDLGQFDEAIGHYRGALEISRGSGDKMNEGLGLHQVGNMLFLKNDLEEALKHYRGALKLREETGDSRGAAYSRGQVGMICQRKGDLSGALEHYRASMELFEEVKDHAGQASALHQLGRIYQEQGDSDRALEFYRRSLDIREERSDMGGIGLGYGQLGLLLYERGEYEEALRASVKAFVVFSRMNAPAVQLARKNILKVKPHVPQEKFREIMQEFNIQFEAPEKK